MGTAQLRQVPLAPMPPTERSVGELLGDLATETSTLVRQEVKLAASEMANKATYAAKQSVNVAIGGLLGLVALGSLVASLILGLGMVMPLWASALLVGSIIAVVAFLVGHAGVTALRQMDAAPTQTIKSLEETKSWAKQQIR